MSRVTQRPSWDTYFMNITALVAQRSTCTRRAVGAIIVKDKRILSTGYNGAPRASGTVWRSVACGNPCRFPRASAMSCAAAFMPSRMPLSRRRFTAFRSTDAVLYCTNQPCSICAKMIINAGIKKIYYQSGYADTLSQEMLTKQGSI